ncbi:MAG: hypothetical protein ACPG7F_15505, partial [Aggregatilineales bacterium]
MNQISAANDHTIRIADGVWQLHSSDKALAQAKDNRLRYSAKFSMTRRLPASGTLEQSDIERVVLGWQQGDESWHLGILLVPHLAEGRGSRWCKLAAWPDPDQTVFYEAAQQAGQRLALTLNVPYTEIPVKEKPAPEPPPPLPLPELPLEVAMWSLSDTGEQLVLERSPKWRRQRFLRMAWLTLWALIYLVVSSATLISDLALPNAGTLLPDPQILPYLGLIIAAGLMLQVIYNYYRLVSSVNRVVINPQHQAVRSYAGQKMKLETFAGEIQSVYISEVVKRKLSDPTIEHGEINLHLTDDSFAFLFQQGDALDNDYEMHDDEKQKPGRRQAEIVLLTRDNCESDLQAMSLYIAEALGNLPTWYDA